MKQMKSTIIRLTKKQREDIKKILDVKLTNWSLTIYGKSYADEKIKKEYDKRLSEITKEYDDVLIALNVLGISIDGHNCNGSIKGILSTTVDEGFLPELGLGISEARAAHKKLQELEMKAERKKLQNKSNEKVGTTYAIDQNNNLRKLVKNIK